MHPGRPEARAAAQAAQERDELLASMGFQRLPSRSEEIEAHLEGQQRARKAGERVSEALRGPARRAQAEKTENGFCYTRSDDSFVTPLLRDAGIDTARFLYRVKSEPAAADRILASLRGELPGPELVQVEEEGQLVEREDRSGLRAGVLTVDGESCLWVEGRPIQLWGGRGFDGLLAPARLPEADQLIRDTLGYLGIKTEPRGISRLDLTARTNQEGSLSDRHAILRGIAALKPPRRKVMPVLAPGNARTVELVYFITPKAGVKQERCYAEALTHLSAEPTVRLESQTRWAKANRRHSEEWTPELCAQMFNRKFEALSKSVNGLVVATPRLLHQELLDRIADDPGPGEVTARQAETLLGYLALRDMGHEFPLRTRQRREAQLRDLGLVESMPALGDPNFEHVELQEVFDRVTSFTSWN